MPRHLHVLRRAICLLCDVLEVEANRNAVLDSRVNTTSIAEQHVKKRPIDRSCRCKEGSQLLFQACFLFLLLLRLVSLLHNPLLACLSLIVGSLLRCTGNLRICTHLLGMRQDKM